MSQVSHVDGPPWHRHGLASRRKAQSGSTCDMYCVVRAMSQGTRDEGLRLRWSGMRLLHSRFGFSLHVVVTAELSQPGRQ